MPFFFLAVYLALLFVAPQLWVEPFVGVRPDAFLYAGWFGSLVLTGRAVELFRLSPQDLFFAGWVAWIVISLAVNGLGPSSTSIVFEYVKWFVLYRLTVVTLPTMTHVQRAALLLLFFGLLLAVEGIQHMNSSTGTGWAGQSFGWVGEEAREVGYKGRTRWLGIFDGPGVFCVVYTMALPFAMQYLGKPFGVAVRTFGLAMFAALLLATYYTGSRGGILATVGVIGLYVLAKSRVSFRKLMVVGGLCMVLLALLPSYFTSTSDSSQSAQHRIEMWAEGIEMVQYNPVFGIGRGNFLSYTSKLIAHNSAIEIMGETGATGLFLWLGIIYMAFKNLLAGYRQNSENSRTQSYIAAIGLSIAGYLMSSIFVTLEYETFYFLLALAAAVAGTLSQKPAFTWRDFWLLGGVMLVFFVAVKSFTMMYFA